MSTRTLNFTALLCAYGSIALIMTGDRLHIALYGLPIVLMTVIAAVRKWNSPRTISLAGLAAFVMVCLSSIDILDTTALVLSAAQVVMVALYGLSLVVDPSTVDHRTLLDTIDGDPLSRIVVRSVVARELRRSRRTNSPLSILSFDSTALIEPSERRELANELQRRAREFDTVYVAPTGELAILCVDTGRAGARHYGERLRMTSRTSDFSIVSFPEDAVTLQGLLDAGTRTPEAPRSHAEAAVVAE